MYREESASEGGVTDATVGRRSGMMLNRRGTPLKQEGRMVLKAVQTGFQKSCQ